MDNSQAIVMRYKNYRGEIAFRKVVPFSLSFGATEYHPEPQWIMRAFDVGRCAYRDFALRDCDFLAARPSPPTGEDG